MGKAFIGSESLFDQIKQIEEMQKKRTVKDIIKVLIAIAAAIISVIFTCFICFVIYKNGLSAESILSVLLAFFSIFISIFFYFKADETSNKFYDSSYGFMKDQSNLLGRIEERFGEKFESIFYKLDHLDEKKSTTEEQMENTQDEIQKMINTAIDVLSEKNIEKDSQLDDLKKRFEEKSHEYQKLRNELDLIQNESQNIRKYIDDKRYKTINDAFDSTFIINWNSFISQLSQKEKEYFFNHQVLQKSNSVYKLALKYNICDGKGLVHPEARRLASSVYANME